MKLLQGILQTTEMVPSSIVWAFAIVLTMKDTKYTYHPLNVLSQKRQSLGRMGWISPGAHASEQHHYDGR